MSFEMVDKVDGLKFHWSNPKFEGLPWSVDRVHVKKTKHNNHKPKWKKFCVKRPVSMEEAKQEIAVLRADFPQCKWWVDYCELCKELHIYRAGTSFDWRAEKQA